MKTKEKRNQKGKAIPQKVKNPLKEVFGTLKFKKSTKEMLEESDKEAWDE